MADNTMQRINDLEIEDATIFSKNFKGAKRVNPKTNKIVNTEGVRGFCVKIDDIDIAQQMLADGWNVKINKTDDPDEPAFCYLPVEARFNSFPPEINLVTGNRVVQLDEEHVHQLDDRKFTKVNLIIHPRRYQNDAGDWKIKAFLHEGWFYLKQSRFAAEWEEHNGGSFEDDMY